MGQCLNRRTSNITKMQKEVKAWQTHRNNKKTTINWQFTNDEARIKIKKAILQYQLDVTLHNHKIEEDYKKTAQRLIAFYTAIII